MEAISIFWSFDYSVLSISWPWVNYELKNDTEHHTAAKHKCIAFNMHFVVFSVNFAFFQFLYVKDAVYFSILFGQNLLLYFIVATCSCYYFKIIHAVLIVISENNWGNRFKNSRFWAFLTSYIRTYKIIFKNIKLR